MITSQLLIFSAHRHPDRREQLFHNYDRLQFLNGLPHSSFDPQSNILFFINKVYRSEAIFQQRWLKQNWGRGRRLPPN